MPVFAIALVFRFPSWAWAEKGRRPTIVGLSSDGKPGHMSRYLSCNSQLREQLPAGSKWEFPGLKSFWPYVTFLKQPLTHSCSSGSHLEPKWKIVLPAVLSDVKTNSVERQGRAGQPVRGVEERSERARQRVSGGRSRCAGAGWLVGC